MKALYILIALVLTSTNTNAQQLEPQPPDHVTVVRWFSLEDQLSLDIDMSHPGKLLEQVAPNKPYPCKVSFSERLDLYVMQEAGKYYLCTQQPDGEYEKFSLPEVVNFWLGPRCVRKDCTIWL